MEGDSKGDFRGDFKQDMEGDLLSSSGQVWFSLQPKFNSFELDSEVGQLVRPKIEGFGGFFPWKLIVYHYFN